MAYGQKSIQLWPLKHQKVNHHQKTGSIMLPAVEKDFFSLFGICNSYLFNTRTQTVI